MPLFSIVVVVCVNLVSSPVLLRLVVTSRLAAIVFVMIVPGAETEWSMLLRVWLLAVLSDFGAVPRIAVHLVLVTFSVIFDTIIDGPLGTKCVFVVISLVVVLEVPVTLVRCSSVSWGGLRLRVGRVWMSVMVVARAMMLTIVLAFRLFWFAWWVIVCSSERLEAFYLQLAVVVILDRTVRLPAVWSSRPGRNDCLATNVFSRTLVRVERLRPLAILAIGLAL